MAMAYFLTWTCHGTWLPGDERGWVDSAHNQYGAPMLAPDIAREDLASRLMEDDPRSLNAEARAIVERAIRDHCELRGWRLAAINVRTTHVHVVVDGCATQLRPEVVMGQFKSWSTRRLREAGLRGPEQRVWTREGSTRYLFTQKALDDAVRYVVEGQGPRLA